MGHLLRSKICTSPRVFIQAFFWHANGECENTAVACWCRAAVARSLARVCGAIWGCRSIKNSNERPHKHSQNKARKIVSCPTEFGHRGQTQPLTAKHKRHKNWTESWSPSDSAAQSRLEFKNASYSCWLHRRTCCSRPCSRTLAFLRTRTLGGTSTYPWFTQDIAGLWPSTVLHGLNTCSKFKAEGSVALSQVVRCGCNTFVCFLCAFFFCLIRDMIQAQTFLDGQPRANADAHPGIVVAQATRRKRRQTYRDLERARR